MAEDSAGASGSRLAVVAGIVAVAGVLVAVAVATRGGADDFGDEQAPAPRTTEIGAAVGAAGCTLRHLPLEGDRETTARVRYRSNPPHSGAHGTVPASDGAYYRDEPGAEAVVHALRHGRVAIWFDPGLDEADKGRLKSVFDESPRHMFLLPREGMRYDVAASAWRRVLGCRELTDSTYDALRAFRDSYRDKGPELVP